MIVLAHALPLALPVADEAPFYVASCPLDLAGVEALLGGPLEVVQLDADTCLLTNGQAREQLRGKNLEASQAWFERHAESGRGADFIHGPVILCRGAGIAHFDHLRVVPGRVVPGRVVPGRVVPGRAEVKPILSALEKAVLRRQEQVREQQRALSQCGDSWGCEMCGA